MVRSYRLKRPVVLFFALLFMTNIAFSQNSDDARDVTTTYFIKNAFVVQKPGKILPNTSILIKNGLIIDVGAHIKPPYDAKIINADSMYVYAGFIDACSHTGIKKKEDKERKNVSNPGNPPKNLAGITPQNTVRNQIGDKLDKSMSELLDLGFGYVHVVPRGRMLPGQGSILSTSNKLPESTIIVENISQFSQFKPAKGMFPGTTIGVMSQFRDLFKNAELSKKYSNSYSANAKGMARPNQSEELTALYSVVDKSMPVFYYTPKIKDVNRALILQEELGFKLVLTGVRQGWPLLKDIKSKNISVVLSLKLPKDLAEGKKEDKKDDDTKDTDKNTDIDKDKTKEKEKKAKKKPKKKKESAETIALKEKRKKSYDQYVGQARIFEKNKLKFAFSTLDTKTKDIKPNILRMIEGGLSENGALAALTTNAATLLGISDVAGTLEKGKIANLFITDKPYFEEKSKIKYIFNDSKLKKSKEKKKKKVDGDVPLSGEWSYEVEVPGQTQTGIILIDGEGDNMTVEIDNSSQPGDYNSATSVSIEDGTMDLEFSFDGMSLSLTLEFEGADFEGTVNVQGMGTFPITGTKKDVPE
ncbi:MAG: amidohydrolase family protein [Saprospiraceae bacterium]